MREMRGHQTATVFPGRSSSEIVESLDEAAFSGISPAQFGNITLPINLFSKVLEDAVHFAQVSGSHFVSLRLSQGNLALSARISFRTA